VRKEVIKYKNKVLVLILRNSEFPRGLNFHTSEKDFLQVATWNYPKGKKTIPHLHKIANRKVSRTQELVFLKKGKMKVRIFDEKGKFLRQKLLRTGDIIIFFWGGHSFEILENNTQVLEVKNGPYLGLEKDKKIIKKNEY